MILKILKIPYQKIFLGVIVKKNIIFNRKETLEVAIVVIIIWTVILIVILVYILNFLSKSALAKELEKEMDEFFEKTKEDMEKYVNKVFKENEVKRKENLKEFENIKNKVSNEDIRMMLEKKGFKKQKK